MASRHFFAGVNTPEGFYSHFDSIADDKECSRKIYFKGGSGMGKSSIMKKVLKRAEEEGYDIDVFHCSSDPASLDGLFIPKLRVAMLDATPPHCYDPKYLGVSGEIFDTSPFLDSDKVKENSVDIIHFAALKSRAFEKAYNFLKAAQPVIHDISLMYKNNMYLHGIDMEAEKLCNLILPKITMPKSGKLRKMFLSAITPDGFINYGDSIFTSCSTIAVKGGYGSDILLKKVMETALTRGFCVEAFYCPMFPDKKLEHIVINDIKTAITTYNYYHHLSYDKVIELDEYMGENFGRNDEAYSSATVLLRQAVAALSEARAAHQFLESFYSPAMDFDSLQIKTELFINSIF